MVILQADCKRAVGQLVTLKNEELDTIMNNEEKIEEILSGLDQVLITTFQQYHINDVLISFSLI